MKPNDEFSLEMFGNLNNSPLSQNYELETAASSSHISIEGGALWKHTLASARRHPQMFIGHQFDAHLEAIRSIFDFLTVARPFRPPFSVHISCSPTQYLVQCKTGSSLNAIEPCFHMNAHRMLIKILEHPNFFLKARANIGNGTYPVCLAEHFFVGIASKSGFRHQTYLEGWPTTEVILSQEKSPYNYVIAAQLSSKWFTGLPFTLAGIESVGETYSSIHVTYEMRPSDDILPMNIDNIARLCY